MEVRVTAPDDKEEEMQEIPIMAPPPTRSLLGVPQQIKSTIGVNNPLNKGGGLTVGSPQPAGLFPMPGSAQVAGGSATGSGRKKVVVQCTLYTLSIEIYSSNIQCRLHLRKAFP